MVVRVSGVNDHIGGTREIPRRQGWVVKAEGRRKRSAGKTKEE